MPSPALPIALRPVSLPPILVIRPEPGATATCAKARALGLEAVAAPLFAVRALDWEPVPRDAVDAVLLGSANALRHGGAGLAAYRGLPAYAVGQATAQAAQKAGFAIAAIGTGGLQSLMPLLAPGHRRLLRLSGRERVELAPPPGVAITLRETYASEPLDMPADLARQLTAPALVLLHSGEAASHFAAEVDRAGLSRAAIHLAALAPRVAARAGEGWASLAVAQSPDDAALLALAEKICHRFSHG